MPSPFIVRGNRDSRPECRQREGEIHNKVKDRETPKTNKKIGGATSQLYRIHLYTLTFSEKNGLKWYLTYLTLISCRWSGKVAFMSKYLQNIRFVAASFYYSLCELIKGHERSILQFSLVWLWSLLQSEESGYSSLQSGCHWPRLVRSSPASENMEINVNLASGSEDTRDGHMQISKQPFTTAGIRWTYWGTWLPWLIRKWERVAMKHG